MDRLPLALKPQSFPEKLLASPDRGPAADSQHSRGNFSRNLTSSLTLPTCKMGRWPWDSGDWAEGTRSAGLCASVEEGGWQHSSRIRAGRSLRGHLTEGRTEAQRSGSDLVRLSEPC